MRVAKFLLIMTGAQFLTYYFAGIIAQGVLGAAEFYPPSPNAISYLRDPHDPALQIWILPAQALRGLLFGIVVLPFVKHLLDLGTWRGGLVLAWVIFVVGYVAASGGMIEHFVYFKSADYPAKFAVITFVEILIQTILLGPLVVGLCGRFGARLTEPNRE